MVAAQALERQHGSQNDVALALGAREVRGGSTPFTLALSLGRHGALQLWRPLDPARKFHTSNDSPLERPRKRARGEASVSTRTTTAVEVKPPQSADSSVHECVLRVVATATTTSSSSSNTLSGRGRNVLELVDGLNEGHAAEAFGELCQKGFGDDIGIVMQLLTDFGGCGADLSLSSCTSFFRFYVLPWLCQLTSKPSRVVSQAAVTAMALRRDIALEVVALPRVGALNFNAVQRVIVSKFLTSSFPSGRRTEVVMHVCRAGESIHGSAVPQWTDEHAATIHAMLQGLGPLTAATLDTLAQGLATSVEALPKSKHLGKLTFAILSRPRSEVIPVRGHLERACQAHDTLLKKSLTVALKRLDSH
jgi:hypothetical protein